jgi:hypothetical protein
VGKNRKQVGRREKGKEIRRESGREAADFVWLYYRSHFLSPSRTQQYKEIEEKKLKKKEREGNTNHSAIKASGSPPRQRQACTINSDSRERREERESICFRSQREWEGPEAGRWTISFSETCLVLHQH